MTDSTKTYRAAWATGFTGNDPLGFDAVDANLRRVVGNDPTNETDPSGLEAVPTGGESNLNGPTAYAHQWAGHLDISVHLPAIYQLKQPDGTWRKDIPGIWIDVTGPDASKVSFIQFVRAELVVNRTHKSSSEKAAWIADTSSALRYEADGKKLRTLHTGVDYLDTSAKHPDKVGYVESGFRGKVGEGDNAWMRDSPKIGQIAQRIWNDSPDLDRVPGLWSQGDVESFTFFERFTTYLVIDGKAVYRVNWYVRDQVKRSTQPKKFEDTFPPQEVGGGDIQSRSEFEDDSSFSSHKVRSKGAMK